jgi:cytochrome c-type biogenesis protein CcmH/NrfG
MDGLGAYHTAADAYAKAVAVEPTVAEYRVDQLTFLTRQFPKDTALVSAAFASATTHLSRNASVYSLEAQWLTGEGRYADAIKAWQTVKTLSPGSDSTAIDTEIARLQAKL